MAPTPLVANSKKHAISESKSFGSFETFQSSITKNAGPWKTKEKKKRTIEVKI